MVAICFPIQGFKLPYICLIGFLAAEPAEPNVTRLIFLIVSTEVHGAALSADHVVTTHFWLCLCLTVSLVLTLLFP